MNMNMQQHQVADEGMGMDLFPTVPRLYHPLETFNATEYTPRPYRPSVNIERQHHFPRFGNTNNFQELVAGLAGSSGTAKDYIVGVCAGAMLIFCVGLLWIGVVVGLKIAGRKKVDFLAGRLEYPVEMSPREDDAGTSASSHVEEEATVDDAESHAEADAASPLIAADDVGAQEERLKREKKFNRKVLAVRATFVLSGAGVVVASCLYYAKGIALFKESLGSANKGLEMIRSEAFTAIQAIDDVNNDKNTLLRDFNNTRAQTGEAMCEGDGIYARQIKKYVNDFSAEVKELSSMVDENVELFKSDLEEVISMTQEADQGLSHANALFYTALTVSIVIIVVIVAMLVVSFFSAKGVSNGFTKIVTHAIIWPLFVIFLALFWVFALLSLVLSLSASDFCVKPDQFVEGIIRKYQDNFHSFIFGFLIYYISGCAVKPTGDGEVVQIADQIKEVVHTVHDLSEVLMKTQPSVLERQCGLDSAAATALQGGAELLHGASHVVNKAWIGVRQLLECKNINPIYTTFVHDAICVQGIEGFTWIFASSFVLVIFAMLMVTFRAALYPIMQPKEQASKEDT
ncbi:hypothetical protein ACHAWF_014640 [Thalassiosira exigua]